MKLSNEILFIICLMTSVQCILNAQDLYTVASGMGWTNFYRHADVTTTAYFYLDNFSSPLPETKLRVANLPEKY